MSAAVRLYAVVPGEEGARLARSRGVACGPLWALTGPGRSRLSEEGAALRHDRVVGAALMACSAVVPFRMGVVLPDAAALRRVLLANLDEIQAALARVRGKVEVGLRALCAGPDAAALLERLRAGLRDLPWEAGADRQHRLTPTATGVILRGSYLIGRGEVEDFFRRLAALRAALPGVPLLGSGPWAPYSFCCLHLRGAAGPAEPREVVA